MKKEKHTGKIYVVAAEKGGVGKTITALRLAVKFAQDKKRVLLVDADEQGSAFKLSIHREESAASPSFTCIKLSDMAVRTEVQKLQKNYDVVVIDSGGRDTKSMRAAVSIADVLLTPCPPASLDIWEISKIDKMVSEMKDINPKLKASAFLNKAEARGKDNQATINYLEDKNELHEIAYMDAPVVARKSISSAAGKGLISNETKPKDKKAIMELDRFYNEVKKILK